MCTSVLYRGEDACFGRTLDLEYAYADRVVLLPAHAPLHFLYQPTLTSHHALLGTAVLHDGQPLWYDALNDQGLAMAGLNFPKSAVYAPSAEGKRNCASFELIPLVLGQCATIPEAHHLLSQVNITPDSVSPAYPATPLHFMLADRFGHTLIAEQTSDGLHLYADESAVMTNEPPLPIQLHKLTDYAHLSAHPPRPAFGTDLQPPYSGGMGAIGLPGDWSSSSRFVRAAFAAANSPDGLTGNAAVTQLLHCLGAAAIPMGCVYKEDGRAMYTRYTSAANLVRGTYTRTTYTDLSPKTYTFAMAEGENAAVKVLA